MSEVLADKENLPAIAPLPVTPTAPTKRPRGRPKGSKTRAKATVIGQAPKLKATKTPKPRQKKQIPDLETPDGTSAVPVISLPSSPSQSQPKSLLPPDSSTVTKPTRAIYSEDDDKILMHVFLEQKSEGMQTLSGGWKKPALQAAVVALRGSEAKSGGAPKTASSVRDHYRNLKTTYRHYKELSEKSGWGWDYENQCVKASDEQWETLLASQPHYEPYRDTPFLIFEEMDELLNGNLATGSEVFHPGEAHSESDSDGLDESDTGHDADVNRDTSLEDISPSKESSSNTIGASKRKTSAFETPVVKKRTRQDRTGRQSTSTSILKMSDAISDVAMALGSTEAQADDKVMDSAVALIEKAEGFDESEKAILLFKLSEDIKFGKLLLKVVDHSTLTSLLRLQITKSSGNQST